MEIHDLNQVGSRELTHSSFATTHKINLFIRKKGHRETRPKSIPTVMKIYTLEHLFYHHINNDE